MALQALVGRRLSLDKININKKSIPVNRGAENFLAFLGKWFVSNFGHSLKNNYWT